MIFSKLSVMVTLVCAAALAGCQSTRMGGQPEPLTPAPSGTIVGAGQLPPPASPGSFPTAPESPQVAALDPSQGATAPANAPAVSKNGMVGSWNTTAGGASCQVFLSLTKFGNFSRGGSRGCSGDLQRMRGWDVTGSQVVLYDDSGNQLATLYSSGGNRYDGRTSGGQTVTLSR